MLWIWEYVQWMHNTTGSWSGRVMKMEKVVPECSPWEGVNWNSIGLPFEQQPITTMEWGEAGSLTHLLTHQYKVQKATNICELDTRVLSTWISDHQLQSCILIRFYIYKIKVISILNLHVLLQVTLFTQHYRHGFCICLCVSDIRTIQTNAMNRTQTQTFVINCMPNFMQFMYSH